MDVEECDGVVRREDTIQTQPEVVPLDQPPGCVFEVDRTQACRA